MAFLAAAAFALVAVAGVLLRPATPIDETRYLSVAWEMRMTGNWLVPHVNGMPYSDKPPLLFWLINLVWLVTGVSETAARLVGPALALGSVALTARLGRRLWPDRPAVGADAAVVLAGFSVFALYGGLTMFDALLTFWTLAAILALHAALSGGRAVAWVGFGVALGLGVLAKGPVILFHTLPLVLAFQLWMPRDRRPRPLAVARGVGIALGCAVLVAALWLVPALILADPEWRHAVLWTQSAGRMAESFAHARPWWWFLPLLPLLLFPWFWAPGTWRGLLRLPRRDPGVRLCLIWAVVALVLFSLTSGKQIHYLVPEFPAVALLVARAQAEARPSGALIPALPIALLALAALLAAAGAIPLGDAGALLQPPLVLAGWAVLAAALAWGGWRLGGAAGITLLGLGLVLAIDILFGATAARGIYGGAAIVHALAEGDEADGIAQAGWGYNAEFNFASRLERPMAELADKDAIDAWAAVHPAGRIVGRAGPKAPDWTPRLTTRYAGRDYGVWFVADRPAK
jgi:4-amino-4-deoxy-L-arabinose transferase-like glycosyltransferase